MAGLGFNFFNYLKRGDLSSLQTFGAIFDGEFHLLAFVKGAVALGLDGGKMNEDIRATFLGNEAVAFAAAEPFDGTNDTI
jgi:hypothetical protein